MQRLPVNLLEPGMIVARQVLNDKGIVLVNEDAELSDQLIMRLENMKIRQVCVKGYPVQLADYMPRTIEEQLADMETAFEPVADDPTMQKLRVLVKAHFIRKNEEMKKRDEQKVEEKKTFSLVDEEELDEETESEDDGQES